MKINNVLYIGTKPSEQSGTGGQYGQLRNRKMLIELYDNVDIIEIPKIGIFSHFKNLLFHKSYGHTKLIWEKIKSYANNEYDIVFFDGTYFGKYVEYFSEKGFKTIVFCHNVEYVFYKRKYDSQKSLTNLLLLYYIRFNEKYSIKKASQIIALNDRDSKTLECYYGRKSKFSPSYFLWND